MGRSFDFEAAANKGSARPPRPCYDKCFVSNCFCCDCCVYAPLNPRTYDPSGKKTRGTSKPCLAQFKQNLFFYLSITILCILNGCFVYFDGLFLMRRIHLAVLIISQVLFFLVLLTLLITACTDPGILTPATDDEAKYFEQVENVPPFVVGKPVKAKLISVHGQPLQLKWCYTCRFFRPPRAVHCGTCNVCIDNFDHHCPWIGNCVGRRNYRSFFLFITSLASMGVYMGACVLTHLILEVKNGTFADAVKKTPASAVELVIILLGIWSVLGLAGLHCFLVISNLTTNEDIKATFVSRRVPNNDNINCPRYQENPFSHGSAYLNCRQVICSSRISTRLRKVPH